MAVEISASWLTHLNSAKAACAAHDFASADQCLKQALEAAHKENAPEQGIAEIFHYFGWCHHAQQQHLEAKRAYGQSLAAYERCFGSTSPQAAAVMHSLGRLLADVGKDDQAEPMFERALAIFRRTANADPATISELESELQRIAKQPKNPAQPYGTPPPLNPEAATAPQTKTLPTPAPQVVSAPCATEPPALDTAPQRYEAVPPPLQNAPSSSNGKRSLPKALGVSAEDGPGYDDIVAGASTSPRGPVDIKSLIHPREITWGMLAKLYSCMLYGFSLLFLVGFVIGPLAVLMTWIYGGIHKGALRSHGIKVSDRQFPEIYKMLLEYSDKLAMPAPDVYVVQADGILNAFANRFQSKDVVILNAEVVEIAYEHGERELAFVLCHELAHVKRGHVRWHWLYSPARFVPFLSQAYSRGCEYTCDRIARYLVPDGALFGLVSLSAGTKLYKRVNLKALYDQQEEEWDFWTWFHEITSTHPNLVNRIRAIGIADQEARQVIDQSQVPSRGGQR